MVDEIKDFHADLKKSHKYNPVIKAELQREFPNATITLAEVADDKMGIDWFIDFPAGRLRVDAKLRFVNYADYLDIILETWSAFPRSIGWALDESKKTDLYYFRWFGDGHHLIVPAVPLRLAFAEHVAEWRKTYDEKTQRNRGYDSMAMGIPASILLPAVKSRPEYAAELKRIAGLMR